MIEDDELKFLRRKRKQVRIPPENPIENNVNKIVDLPSREFEKEAKRMLKTGYFVGFPKSQDPFRKVVEIARKHRENRH